MTAPDAPAPRGIPMRILDLFCGAGGAAMGLHRAWPDAEIIGVDIRPQMHYPFRFVVGDAVTFPLDGFDFIWASPPCQRYSRFTPNVRKPSHPDLIPPTREMLEQAKRPYVIENVPCSPLRVTVKLFGAQFGSRLIRERWFETNFVVLTPEKPKPIGEPLHFGGNSKRRRVASKLELEQAMGIDWMLRSELAEAVPPAYSEYIARQWEIGHDRP